MKVLVQRGTGDNQASEALIDELCNTLTPATAKGQSFLYQEGFDKMFYDIEMPFRIPLICGDLLEMNDNSLGESFKARLSGWSVNIELEVDTIQINQQLSLERSLVNE